MIRKLLDWAVHNPILVLLAAGALVIIGGYAFLNVNVEAYPDPAPPIIEVVAIDPGASAEEVERQVTIPLEVALSGMPGLQVTRTRSCFGLAHVRAQFTYARDYEQAKQDVINRLANVNLPPTVQPMISPASPIGEIFRYTFSVPRDAKGGLIYSWADIKSLQDYLVQRELLRVPRIGGVVSSGGLIKRYEIQPDPDRLFQYGISLAQMQKAVGDSNGNGSGDNLTLGQANLVVRSLGLYGDGEDPMLQVLGWSDPAEAAAYLRAEETRRGREIRQTVVASVNNVPIRVDHLVDGGPLLTTDGAAKVSDADLTKRGVIVSNQTRQGKISISRPKTNPDGSTAWTDEDEQVQGIVIMRKGQESLPALHDVEAKIKELNEPGHLLPGVQLVPYYDRTELIHVTTETVRENLLVGMALVSMILLMFLSDVRVALIVAVNIPLALLFAFGLLFLRGKSATCFPSGGRFRHHRRFLGHRWWRASIATLPPMKMRENLSKSRVSAACGEVERSLFFSTIIMAPRSLCLSSR
ncbi:MAG: efflux RND transporter permease subunit [Gemmataceae bacterium]